jgi:hypothetical protein
MSVGEWDQAVDVNLRKSPLFVVGAFSFSTALCQLKVALGALLREKVL